MDAPLWRRALFGVTTAAALAAIGGAVAGCAADAGDDGDDDEANVDETTSEALTATPAKFPVKGGYKGKYNEPGHHEDRCVALKGDSAKLRDASGTPIGVDLVKSELVYDGSNAPCPPGQARLDQQELVHHAHSTLVFHADGATSAATRDRRRAGAGSRRRTSST